MTFTIRKLTPDLEGDYLRFFDDVAFTDHEEWSWCYCTYMHMDKQSEQEMEEAMKGNTKGALRAYARELIQSENLRGYLAYDGDAVVGWCNAGPKGSFKRLAEEKKLWDEDSGEGTLSVVCYIIAPDRRRQGIATALLERVVDDARAAGMRYVEAYPRIGTHDCYHNFYGYEEMYRKQGFETHAAIEEYELLVLRKAL